MKWWKFLFSWKIIKFLGNWLFSSQEEVSKILASSFRLNLGNNKKCWEFDVASFEKQSQMILPLYKKSSASEV